MRLLPFLLALAAFGSGCLEDTMGDVAEEPSADARNVRTETKTLDILQPVGVPGAPSGVAGGSAAFEAPAGTVAITVDAVWSCITQCPMRVALVAPDETVAAEETGGSNVQLLADPAAPGWWTIRWAPRDVPNVGIQGEATVTFTIAV